MHLSLCILPKTRNIPLAKDLLLRKLLTPLSCNTFTTRKLCQQSSIADDGSVKDTGGAKRFVTFKDMVNSRRAEAERSILVQVQSARSARDLHAYCNSMGTVKYMFHYSLGIEPMHFILVEFGSKCEVDKILAASTYLDTSQVVPVHSPFLWFRAVSKKDSRLKNKNAKLLNIENATTLVNDDDLNHILSKCQSVSEQIIQLYEQTRLNDVGSRLRFLTARQIEMSLSGMFPHARVYPFGSSVNGFGKMGCDLDLVMRLTDVKVDESKRLVFHGKASPGTERSASQKNLESVGDLIQLFLPGCAQVRRILQARVPIVKYNQQLTGIECDLSMMNINGVQRAIARTVSLIESLISYGIIIWGGLYNNALKQLNVVQNYILKVMYKKDKRYPTHLLYNENIFNVRSGYHMSDLLYIMGCFDERVIPLVYAVRKWAKEVCLTSTSPGKWISNFSLTLLVLAFLQRPIDSSPILPSLNSLIKAARPTDRYITEDGINCTFLRDISKLQHKIKNEENLATLLKEFFEFYAQFDFSTRALSLNEAVCFPKPEHSPLYIVNPLERGLNVSKNVSMDEVERFKTEVRNAAWILESQENKRSNWGLLSIFNRKPRLEPLIFPTRQERLMEISALFDDDVKETEVDKVEFKNESIKKQVQDIRSDTKQKLEDIKSHAKSNR